MRRPRANYGSDDFGVSPFLGSSLTSKYLDRVSATRLRYRRLGQPWGHSLPGRGRQQAPPRRLLPRSGSKIRASACAQSPRRSGREDRSDLLPACPASARCRSTVRSLPRTSSYSASVRIGRITFSGMTRSRRPWNSAGVLPDVSKCFSRPKPQCHQHHATLHGVVFDILVGSARVRRTRSPEMRRGCRR